MTIKFFDSHFFLLLRKLVAHLGINFVVEKKIYL